MRNEAKRFVYSATFSAYTDKVNVYSGLNGRTGTFAESYEGRHGGGSPPSPFLPAQHATITLVSAEDGSVEVCTGKEEAFGQNRDAVDAGVCSQVDWTCSGSGGEGVLRVSRPAGNHILIESLRAQIWVCSSESGIGFV